MKQTDSAANTPKPEPTAEPTIAAPATPDTLPSAPASSAPKDDAGGKQRPKDIRSGSKAKRHRHQRPSRPGFNRRNPRASNGADRVTYAALDLGTNNCRLLCAKPSRRGFTVVDAFSRIIRLGEGVSQTGRLSPAAMDRTIRALRVCSEKMARRDVRRSRLIATEACRMAENGEHFIERVRRETGLRLEIVDRETEAKLAVAGCASLLDNNSDWALVFDIGGGSSEIIWLDLKQQEGQWRRSLSDRLSAHNTIHAWDSLKTGVVTLAERFGGRFVDAEVFEKMVAHVTGLLEDFETRHRMRDRIEGKSFHFLGTSGTVTTVAGIHLELPRYERSKVDGCWLDVPQARTVTNNLVAMDYAQRIAQPCVGHERADLVLAGCAILEALMRMWPAQRLRVADRGLREGILSSLMAEDGVHERQRRTRHRGAQSNGRKR